MVASVLILILSTALLGYWFRYSCILLLRNYAEDAKSRGALPANFGCAEVQDRLPTATQLDPLQEVLNRDFAVLTYLLRHASGIKLDGMEEKLLLLDYKTMRFWYAVTRTAAPESARRALHEMASVVMILAGRIGHRAGLAAEA